MLAERIFFLVPDKAFKCFTPLQGSICRQLRELDMTSLGLRCVLNCKYASPSSGLPHLHLLLTSEHAQPGRASPVVVFRRSAAQAEGKSSTAGLVAHHALPSARRAVRHAAWSETRGLCRTPCGDMPRLQGWCSMVQSQKFQTPLSQRLYDSIVQSPI